MTRLCSTFMLLAGLATLPMRGPAPARAQDCVVPLILNGSAEDTAGTAGSPAGDIPSWSFSGGMRSMRFGAPGSLTGIPSDFGEWGQRYFDGGNSDLAVATQLVPVRPECEATYDAHFYFIVAQVRLGTVAGEPDAAWLDVRFLDAAGLSLGGFRVGEPPDGTPGTGATNFVAGGSAPLPFGTRATEFRLYLQNFNGGRNTAWADLLFAGFTWPDPVQRTTWGGLKALYR